MFVDILKSCLHSKGKVHQSAHMLILILLNLHQKQSVCDTGRLWHLWEHNSSAHWDWLYTCLMMGATQKVYSGATARKISMKTGVDR